MSLNSLRGCTFLCSALAAFAATAIPAHAQGPPSPSVTGGTSLRYLGTAGDDNVRFTLANGRFIVDDAVALKIGGTCEPVAGDPTKASCPAAKVGNKFREFTVVTSNGNDRVVNATSTVSTLGAPMRASAGHGNDRLVGDARVDDVLLGSDGNDDLFGVGGQNELDGGAGDDNLTGGSGGDELVGGSGDDDLDGGASDDTLDGGLGQDVMDGGPAGIKAGERHDRVLYSDRTGDVTVDLARTDASQGTQAKPSLGILAERDMIVDVEDVVGGSGDDFLFGNAFNNTMDGGAGNDAVSGLQGFDVLAGGDGNDFMIPSPPPTVGLPIGALPDAQADIIECGKIGIDDGDPGDSAFRVVQDRDVVNDCATVIDQ